MRGFHPNIRNNIVFVRASVFSIRNITLILKRRAKATCEAIPSARAFALLVCGELSDCDPPMCFKLSSRRRFPPWLSCRHRSSCSPCQIVVKLGIGDAKGAAVLLWPN
jgi:hypothetical protein